MIEDQRTRADLDRTMRNILGALEMVSNGTTQSFNAAGGGGGSDQLQGCNGAEHLYWAERYGPPVAVATRASARDDIERAAVIEAANEELERLRGHGIDRSHVTGETRADEDARILKDGEGFNAGEVALRFHCTPTRVRRVRLADGREITYGKKPSAEITADEDAAASAARMKGNGMSERQIALALGRHRTTVTRWLKAA